VRQHIGVIFREKSLPILLVSKPNLVPKCALYPFKCMPNLKAIQLPVCILCQVIASVWKKNNNKISDFLQDHISGTAYFRAYVFSPDMLAPAMVLFELEITELRMGVKSYFILRINSLKLCVHALFSWLHDTLPCVLGVSFKLQVTTKLTW